MRFPRPEAVRNRRDGSLGERDSAGWLRQLIEVTPCPNWACRRHQEFAVVHDYLCTEPSIVLLLFFATSKIDYCYCIRLRMRDYTERIAVEIEY